jgi:flavodoxin
MMQTRLDVSRGSIYNYREKLEDQGALLPHPSVDGKVVGEARLDEARRYAAAVTDKRNPGRINISGMEEIKQERYSDDPDEYLGEFVDDWGRDAYYVSEEAYREGVWGIIQEAVKGMALAEDPSGLRRRPGHDDKRMYEMEKAAGAGRMLVDIISRFGVEINKLQEVREMAVDVTSKDDLEEWAEKWADVRAEVEAELIGQDADEDAARDTFREIVGVNPAESDEDELLEEFRAWIKENHPDVGEDSDDVDLTEWRRVANAKQTLLG